MAIGAQLALVWAIVALLGGLGAVSFLFGLRGI